MLSWPPVHTGTRTGLTVDVGGDYNHGRIKRNLKYDTCVGDLFLLQSVKENWK